MGGGGSSTQPTRLAGVQVSTSAQGLVIPKVWGTGRLKTNMLWYGNFTSTANTAGGKGGGSQTTGYNYNAAVILGVCAGPVAGVTAVYIDKSVYTSPAGAGLSLATGALGQAPWGWLTSNYPSQAIGYSGIAYLYAPSYSLGTSGSTPNISMEVKSAYTFGALPDCLPDVVLADFLTDAVNGVPGWPAGVMASLTSYSTYCQAANLLISPVIDTQVQASSFLDDLMLSTNSACFWSEGQFKVMPLGDGPVTGNGVTWTPNLTPAYSLTDDSYIPPSDGEAPIYVDISDQTDAYNIIQVEFLDRTNQYNTAIASRQDDSNIAQYGPRKQDPKTLHMICDPTVANNIAQIILQQVLYIRGEYHFTLPWNYALLEQCDLLALNDGGMGLANFLVRITQIDDDEFGCRAITAQEVPVGVASPPIYAHQDTSGYTPNGGVAGSPVSAPLIFNPPSTLTQGGQETWIAVAGSVPSTWGGCNVWTSLDNANYQMVGTTTTPSRYGLTTASFPVGTDPDTTNTLAVDLTLSSGALLTATAADENGLVTLCLVDNELVAYQSATLTSAYHYSLTGFRRGAEGTTIAAHTAGAPFVRLDGSPFVIPFNASQAGKTVYVKLQSFNPLGGGLQDLSTCVAYSFVPATQKAGASSTGNTVTGAQLASTQNQTFYQATDPALAGTINDGAIWTNTTTSTLNLRIGGAWVIISTLTAVTGGTVMFDSSSPGSWSFTVPLGATASAQVEIWGGGGGADGSDGGGGGGYSTTTYTVTPGTTIFGGLLGGGGLGKDSTIPISATSGSASTLATGGAMTANGGGCAVTTTPGAGGTATGGTTNTTGTAGSTSYGGGAGNGGGSQTAAGGWGTYPGGGGMTTGSPAANGYGAAGRVRITAR